MSTANLHILYGRLGKDPEVRGQGPKAYIHLTIATDEYAKGKGPEKDGKPTDFITNWHNATVFGDQAVYVSDKYKKGDFIHLQGPIEVKTYEKKDRDGNLIDPNATSVRMIVKVVAGEGTKVARAAAAPAGASTANGNGKAAVQRPAAPSSDDIPF